MWSAAVVAVGVGRILGTDGLGQAAKKKNRLDPSPTTAPPIAASHNGGLRANRMSLITRRTFYSSRHLCHDDTVEDHARGRRCLHCLCASVHRNHQEDGTLVVFAAVEFEPRRRMPFPH